MLVLVFSDYMGLVNIDLSSFSFDNDDFDGYNSKTIIHN